MFFDRSVTLTRRYVGGGRVETVQRIEHHQPAVERFAAVIDALVREDADPMFGPVEALELAIAEEAERARGFLEAAERYAVAAAIFYSVSHRKQQLEQRMTLAPAEVRDLYKAVEANMQARGKEMEELNDVGLPAIKRIKELRRHLDVVRDAGEQGPVR
jgi:hypothetical protein